MSTAGTPPDAPLPLAERIAALLCEPASVRGAPPDRLVVAGQLPTAVRDALPAALQIVSAEEAGANAAPLAPDAPAATGVLMLPPELAAHDALEPGRLDRVLGTACRRFPGRLVVWQHDADAVRALSSTRFFAHGFRRRLLERHEGGGQDALYDFRLADYKQPPDWLNARFWANPERFALDP